MEYPSYLPKGDGERRREMERDQRSSCLDVNVILKSGDLLQETFFSRLPRLPMSAYSWNLEAFFCWPRGPYYSIAIVGTVL
jgi:hypothetical protein